VAVDHWQSFVKDQTTCIQKQEQSQGLVEKHHVGGQHIYCQEPKYKID